nr:protein O-linked-mannose beta-1,4-N-acetylglucosaminyltransferase 2-like [Ipomoea batatas]GME13849.1 protein O-linked-mannose beta-1,4-N-acetylglucosaminyltransferase 2-like [Ipomoea batatas]
MTKNIRVLKKSASSKLAIQLLCFSSLFAFFIVYHMARPSSTSTVHALIVSTMRNSTQVNVENTPMNGPTTTDIIICDRSQYYYDICSINGPAVFDPAQSTFFIKGPKCNNGPNLTVEKVRPYIKEVTLTKGPLGPTCDVHHAVPALVFSAGGYTGNFFHDFNDGFIPLFITVNSVFPNQDFVLVISQLQDWWVVKYRGLLRNFSKYAIVDFDKENITHCFPRVTVGLMSHGFMTIDPKLIPTSKTILDFRTCLATTYGNTDAPPDDTITKPRLVLTSRNGSLGRVILNQYEVKILAEKIGFEVIMFEPHTNTSLAKSFGLINSSHAMLGVHGAALTHAMFLRPGSVFIQIVPIGADGVSELCFGKLAKNLELEYEEYKIEMHESSLADKYGKEDSEVLNDPLALQARGWSKEIMDIYLREQNVRLDLKRLRTYLQRAYHKAKVFMDKNG